MTNSNNCRIVVLLSGNGSNLQAIIDAIAAGDIAGEVVGVISNKADAYGLVRASDAGIESVLVEHHQFSCRNDFDEALTQAIDNFQADLIVLAGFMRILGSSFVEKYKGQLVNIHPSLLPKHQGLHTHRRALQAKDKVHGATIHFVTEELDGGPIIAQEKLSIEKNDTELSLSQRVQQLEYKLYPKVIHWFCTGRLELADNSVKLDNKLI